MDNVIPIRPLRESRESIAKKELARLEKERPIVMTGAHQFFLTVIQVLQENGFQHGSFHDLFYGGCIFIGMLFSKLPNRPRYQSKSGRQAINMLLLNAKEGRHIAEPLCWLNQPFSLSLLNAEMPPYNYEETSLLQYHFFETAHLIRRLCAEQADFFSSQQHHDEKKMIKNFTQIEFPLREKLTALIKEESNRYQAFNKSEAGTSTTLFLHYQSRLAHLASISALLLQQPLMTFMQAGTTKFLKVTGYTHEPEVKDYLSIIDWFFEE